MTRQTSIVETPLRACLVLLTAVLATACGDGDPEPNSNCSTSTTAIAQSSQDLTFLSYTTVSTASAEKVWSVWMDVQGWPVWDLGLKQARSQGPLAVGVPGSYVPQQGPESTFTVVSFDDRKSYSFVTPLPDATLILSRTLSQRPDGTTTLTHNVQFAGAQASQFAALFSPGFKTALPSAVEGVARLAERCAMLVP
jgi:Polyketide cyclase / dehydrase and lipid transport